MENLLLFKEKAENWKYAKKKRKDIYQIMDEKASHQAEEPSVEMNERKL